MLVYLIFATIFISILVFCFAKQPDEPSIALAKTIFFTFLLYFLYVGVGMFNALASGHHDALEPKQAQAYIEQWGRPELNACIVESVESSMNKSLTKSNLKHAYARCDAQAKEQEKLENIRELRSGLGLAITP